MSNIVGLNPKKVRIYIPKADQGLPDEEKPLKFQMRLLTAREAADLRDEIYEISGVGKKRKERLRSGTHELRVLYRCIEGWENFFDDDSKEIPYRKTVKNNEPFIENLDYLPDDLRTELARYASRENEVDEDTEKNSGSLLDGQNGSEQDE